MTDSRSTTSHGSQPRWWDNPTNFRPIFELHHCALSNDGHSGLELSALCRWLKLLDGMESTFLCSVIFIVQQSNFDSHRLTDQSDSAAHLPDGGLTWPIVSNTPREWQSLNENRTDESFLHTKDTMCLKACVWFPSGFAVEYTIWPKYSGYSSSWRWKFPTAEIKYAMQLAGPTRRCNLLREFFLSVTWTWSQKSSHELVHRVWPHKKRHLKSKLNQNLHLSGSDKPV